MATIVVNKPEYPKSRHGSKFVLQVFKVHDPPCPACKNDMDFNMFIDYQGTGQDWIQWFCIYCGYMKNVEIL